MLRHVDGQIIGESLSTLPEMLDRLGCRRVLLVLDRGAAEASGCLGSLRDAMGERFVGVFDAFTPNPSSDQPLNGAWGAVELGADTMLAVGGGSCMDVAKVGALAAGAPERSAELVRGGPSAGARPLCIVAVPTTSGTGSEATHFAAIYVEGKKVSVAHPGMRPRAVVLDAGLHVAMPSFVAATTGLDALCQATESIWAVGATPGSRAAALDAQARIVAHLVSSVRATGRADREQMMLGAHLAGRAINISKTTAAHALSYELTTRFGIAHGLGVALTFGHVAAFNAGVTPDDCAHPAGAEHARRGVLDACAAFGVAPGDMPERMRDLLGALDLPATLRAAGVPREALPQMAGAADTVRLSNNPRRFSLADALGVLERAY